MREMQINFFNNKRLIVIRSVHEQRIIQYHFHQHQQQRIVRVRYFKRRNPRIPINILKQHQQKFYLIDESIVV